MKHKKLLCMILAVLLVTSVFSPIAFAAEVPKDKYTLTYQQVGTEKQNVTCLDYDIENQELEIILIPKGSDIVFKPTEIMSAFITGLEKADGEFYDTYDGVPWVIDGVKSLVNGVDGGKTATGTLEYYEYYLMSFSDDADNKTRLFFRTVEGAANEPIPAVEKPDDWAVEGVEKAISLNLIPEILQNQYKEKITRSDFCLLITNLIEQKTGKSIDAILAEKGLIASENIFADTSEPFIINASALGIVNGKGNGIFDPNGSISRQEAAVMLTNAAKVLGLQIESADAAYNDSSAIDDWAKSAVNFVTSAGVMNGTGENNFSPKDTFIREQAYITVLRLFINVK